MHQFFFTAISIPLSNEVWRIFEKNFEVFANEINNFRNNLGFGFSTFAQNEKSGCPIIQVSGGGVIQLGEPMFFTVPVDPKISIASGSEQVSS